MQFTQMFDARSVEPSQVAVPIPAGDYKVRIIASEPKPTKEGDGGFLELKLQILEGQYQNRELFYRLNLFNKSQQAVEIAYRQLSALCHVTGVFNIQNSEQLHGIPFVVIVTIQSGGAYNDIKGVKDLAGNIPGKPGNVGVASAMPAAAPQASFPQAAPQMFPPPAAAAPPWATPAAPAPPQQQWGPPAPQQQPQAPAAAPWSPPGANMAPPAPAPSWGPPAGAPAPMPPQAAAPPWAQQPQPTAAPPQPPTWGK